MVNLEDWVERYNGNWLYYLVRQLPYTIDGIYTPNVDFDIIKIQPMNKKEQLKQQIKALEAELKNLEKADKVPEGFDEEGLISFL